MGFEINLKGKVAVVTGVTSGIGKGVAKFLAKAGCNVAGCAQSPLESDIAKDFIEIIENENVKCIYRKVDVTQSENLKSFVGKVINTLGKIDIVVSNAGANLFQKPEECTDLQWQINIDLNLKSHWQLSRYCKPHLEKSNNGVILIMTSNHGFQTLPSCFPYNIMKTALTGMVRSLAIDWSPKIRTVGIAPGFITTESAETWFDSFPYPNKKKQKIVDIHPVKRLGTVDDVGAFCVFLSSDYARFITGTTYLIDGGRSAIMQDL